MNSFERVMSAISHREPDRVPVFLLLSLYGAKELEMHPKQYFAKAENIIKAQLKMREKYNNDCLYTFLYAPVEIEAFGAEVIYADDGPPNSGDPFIKDIDQILSMKIPEAEKTPCLNKVLEVTWQLKKEVKDTVPIIGVVMSPFSLPVMQVGFEKYLEMIYTQKDYFDALMRLNEEFCVGWANAQLAAGATAICYFNPLASPNMIEKQMYLTTGYPVDKRTLSRINGPTATHLASGVTYPVIEEIIATGSAVVGFSTDDDLALLKEATKGRICLMGCLNGIEMVNWDHKKTSFAVKEIISKAGEGGGLILSDNHGEIPWQVPEEVLLEISEAAMTHGVYPREMLL